MAYKISGTKSGTARVIVLKESDWSVESETVISGSGVYEVDGLSDGYKSIMAIPDSGTPICYTAVDPVEYATPPGDRGLFAGGYSTINTIDYITISTTATAQDFGDLTQGRFGLQSVGSTDRAVFGGGSSNYTIDYVTISTPSNASSFGTLLVNHHYYGTSASNNTRGLFAGGGSPPRNLIHYITISTLSNSTNFGDLLKDSIMGAGVASPTRAVFLLGTVYAGHSGNIDYVTISTLSDATTFGSAPETQYAGGASSATRGLFAGGSAQFRSAIQYITIASTGDATNFGGLTVNRSYIGATSNGTRAVFGGGHTVSNTIDYVTISTLSSATDFGDLTYSPAEGITACSNGHGGLQ